MLVIQSKKLPTKPKFSETEKKNITIDHGHDKYITTEEFNNLTSENPAAILRPANLAIKSDISYFTKNTKQKSIK